MRRNARSLISYVLLGAMAIMLPELGRGADCQPAWTLVSSPSVADGENPLGALAVVSQEDIWAAGNYVEGDVRHPLIEHWDGKAWSVLPSPDGPRKITWLPGLAAVVAKDVWAVGYSQDAFVGESLSETFILRWDGGAWSRVTSPNVSTRDVSEEFGGYPVSNELMAVAAAAKDDVWAVGRSYTIVRGQELIIHWDGTSWSVVPSPHPGVSGWLRSVVAVTKTDVWALGEYYKEISLGEEGGTGNLQQNLILHWDGSSWSEVASPNVGLTVNGIFSASVVSGSDIWAVGYHLLPGPNNLQKPTILHWDGVGWSVVQSPNLNDETAYLFSISALAPDQVFAVGFYDTGPPVPRYDTLIEYWNGFKWSVMSSLNPAHNHYLYAVAAILPDDVWAVGEAFSEELPYGTLIEHYTGSCPEALFVRGDANADLALDISDAITALDYLFQGGSAPCLDSLDVDDDGAIDISDPIYLLSFIFQGGPEPHAPYPVPGPDTTPDDHDCGGSV